MTTLRDLWKSKNMTSTELAAAAGCSVPTIYKLNRRGGEESEVKLKTVRSICRVLGITLEEFEQLDACPHADYYRHGGKP